MDFSADKAGKVLSESPKGDHYRGFAIEPIQYTEANKLGFHEGNIIKYVTRWKLKNGLEDLEKAKFYIDRLIEIERRHQPDPPLGGAPVSEWQIHSGHRDLEDAIVHAVASDPGDETSWIRQTHA